LASDETVNCVSLGGRRITLENVAVNRQARRQGASKLAEFAPNGDQILLDRCSVARPTWTMFGLPLNGSGHSCPIVLLNCAFHGFTWLVVQCALAKEYSSRHVSRTGVRCFSNVSKDGPTDFEFKSVDTRRIENLFLVRIDSSKVSPSERITLCPCWRYAMRYGRLISFDPISPQGVFSALYTALRSAGTVNKGSGVHMLVFVFETPCLEAVANRFGH
jgi:hypothetical protein